TYVPRSEQPGANLGWPIMEGSRCFRPAAGCNVAGLILPTLEYSHSEGCSVTGGYVYRGNAIPGLSGTYFYGDFCGGWVRSFRISGGSAVEQLEYSGFPQGDNVVGFGEDAAGEIYVVMASGTLYLITGQPVT
ncbi:MAG: PQQ-dependent sugar dehydrogenase, partial [Gemmatimonadales bacterium]